MKIFILQMISLNLDNPHSYFAGTFSTMKKAKTASEIELKKFTGLYQPCIHCSILDAPATQEQSDDIWSENFFRSTGETYE